MKVVGPLLSLRASGWLGKDTYAVRGVVTQPYPIALRAAHYPYRMRIHGWGAYYHPYGWVYERRRTWHGIISIAKRATLENVRYTPAQLAQRQKFKYGMTAWKSMDNRTQNIYNKLKYPPKASGRCRFLHYYLTDKPI